MRITVTDPITEYDGTPMTEPVRPDKPGDPMKRDLIFRTVFSTALNNTTADEKPRLPEELSKVYRITNKLYASKEVDLTVDEAALIKERVGKIYAPSPRIYGLTCDLLDGNTKEK